jgi:hypothetical protein
MKAIGRQVCKYLTQSFSLIYTFLYFYLNEVIFFTDKQIFFLFLEIHHANTIYLYQILKVFKDKLQ